MSRQQVDAVIPPHTHVLESSLPAIHLLTDVSLPMTSTQSTHSLLYSMNLWWKIDMHLPLPLFVMVATLCPVCNSFYPLMHYDVPSSSRTLFLWCLLHFVVLLSTFSTPSSPRIAMNTDAPSPSHTEEYIYMRIRKCNRVYVNHL